jgi:type VI protein secretion system component Hcp
VTRMFAAMVIVVALATAAAAQGPPGLEKKEAPEHSSISIKVSDLKCTTSLGSGAFNAISYAFGATNPSSIATGAGGSGGGKATIMPLNVTKPLDECSPALFGAVLSGDHLKTVDLTQEDNKGHEILTIKLQDAQITSYQIGGSQASDSPHESIQIEFRKICISEPSSGNKLCFDRSTNTAF